MQKTLRNHVLPRIRLFDSPYVTSLVWSSKRRLKEWVGCLQLS